MKLLGYGSSSVRKSRRTISIVILICFGLVTKVCAQGQINFFTFNLSTSFGQVFTVELPSYRLIGPAGGTLVGQLYGGLSNDQSHFVAIGTPSLFASYGYINYGTVSVAETFGGQTYFYQLRVWDSVRGGTFEEGGFFYGAGISPVASIILGGIPAGGGPPISPSNANGFSSFSVFVIPEPSTIALGLLSAIFLLQLRRKN
jgi:hypothetical protein